MAAGIWVRLMRKTRIDQDTTVECTMDHWQEALEEACHKLDVPRPIWLNKHTDEIDRFGRTAFIQEHFVESIEFDRFEIEFLREKHRSTDPRNDFGAGL